MIYKLRIVDVYGNRSRLYYEIGGGGGGGGGGILASRCPSLRPSVRPTVDRSMSAPFLI